LLGGYLVTSENPFQKTKQHNWWVFSKRFLEKYRFSEVAICIFVVLIVFVGGCLKIGFVFWCDGGKLCFCFWFFCLRVSLVVNLVLGVVCFVL
jgi:hypothetical protein